MSGVPAIVVVGCTATGKTELALALAEALGGEVVGADSRQVYRHLDVGTAKPSAAERARVPHHLLDVAEPDERFDAARYRTLALAAVHAIHRRGRLPVICGGTGLYVRALLYGLFRGPAAEPDVRRALCAAEDRGGPGTLHRRLAACDPVSAARLHPHDLMRIVRALEVLEVTGRPISAWQREHAFGERGIDALVLGCARPPGELAARIATRCRAMLAAGLLDEIRALWARGYGPELPPLRSVGYREMGAHLRGATSFAAAVDAFERATRRLAKRQRTWFRADPTIEWFHPEDARAAVVSRASAWREGVWRGPTSTSSVPSSR